MKHFTRFLCLFFAAAMLLTMAACGSKNTDTDTDTKTGSEKKQLVVATSPDFPPFESLDGSDIVGIEPKLMQAIADKLGMELVWEQVDFDSIIPGIQAGRYDAGVAGISITADRLKNCDFSDPYFLANQVIVVNPGSDIQSKADLTGKTTQVNYFLIDRRAYLVDLPGYGYARVSQAEKERWAKLMESYFQEEADRITTGVLIVDIRHKPTANDLVMHDWFRQTGCPEIVVANKLDKLKKSQVEPALQLVRETLELTEADILLPFSAEKGMGKEDLIRLLVQTCGG